MFFMFISHFFVFLTFLFYMFFNLFIFHVLHFAFCILHFAFYMHMHMHMHVHIHIHIDIHILSDMDIHICIYIYICIFIICKFTHATISHSIIFNRITINYPALSDRDSLRQPETQTRGRTSIADISIRTHTASIEYEGISHVYTSYTRTHTCTPKTTRHKGTEPPCSHEGLTLQVFQLHCRTGARNGGAVNLVRIGPSRLRVDV